MASSSSAVEGVVVGCAAGSSSVVLVAVVATVTAVGGLVLEPEPELWPGLERRRAAGRLKPQLGQHGLVLCEADVEGGDGGGLAIVSVMAVDMRVCDCCIVRV